MIMNREISKLSGNYGSLSFPVLGVLKGKTEESYFVNEVFIKTFLSDFTDDESSDLIKEKIKKLIQSDQVHHKGNIYTIDNLGLDDGVKYYLYSLSNQSVNHSFLWLKHDLLNILNPIMGFADILEDSDDLIEEDLVLAKKIKNNSDKLYHQIQKLSLLQNLENKQNIKSGSYDIEDFIKELSNQLLVNNIVDNISKTEVAHQGKVSDRIIQSDFRSTLEEHIEYLTNFQKHKDLKILSVFYNQTFRIKILLNECHPPESYLELIEEVDNFINDCQPITKLQISAVNFLILNEICDIFGAQIKQRKEANDIIIEISLPSLTNEEDIITLAAGDNEILGISHTDNYFKEMPIELYSQIKDLCMQFDGLLILDEWQKVNEQLLIINSKFNNEYLDFIIKEINTGIQSFDVERLRKIYQKCAENIDK